ncbi:MAG: hypothetical protein ACQSGP_14790, partial [Frankia sp.]
MARTGALAGYAWGEPGAQARLVELGVTDPRGAGAAWAAYQTARSDLVAAEQTRAQLPQGVGDEAATAGVEAARVRRDASLRSLTGFGFDEETVVAFPVGDDGGPDRMEDHARPEVAPTGGWGGDRPGVAAEDDAARVEALAAYARGEPGVEGQLVGVDLRAARDAWLGYQAARVDVDQALFAYKRVRPREAVASAPTDPAVAAAAERVTAAVGRSLAAVGELRKLGFDGRAVLASGRMGDGSAVDADGRAMRIGLDESRLGPWWRELNNSAEVEAAWRRFVVALRVADAMTSTLPARAGGTGRQEAEETEEARAAGRVAEARAAGQVADDALQGVERLGVTPAQRANLEAATVWDLVPDGGRLLGGAPFDERAVGSGGERVLPDGNHLVLEPVGGLGQVERRGRVMAPGQEGPELFAGVVTFPAHDWVRITGNGGVYREYRDGVDGWEGGRPLTGPTGSPEVLAERFRSGSDPVLAVLLGGNAVPVARERNPDGGFVLTEVGGAGRLWRYGPDFRLRPPDARENYRAARVELEEALAGYARVREWEAVGSASVNPVVVAAAG